MFDLNGILRTIRSASFNNEVALDLLLELGINADSYDQAYRVLDTASHMAHDSIVLEELYQAIKRGEIHLVTGDAQNTIY